jgi:HPt (histidine-containing phosphotransfer) domain-containing protein
METLPLLDPAPLKSLYLLPGGPESVLELIGIVEEDLPMRLRLIREFLGEGRYRDAGIEAHSLKGGAGNMGLRRFADVAKDLEYRLRDEGAPDCEGLLLAMEELFPPSLEALKTAFPLV